MGPGDIIYVQILMGISTGVQEIYRFCLGNLKVCNAIILTGGMYGVRRCNEFRLHNTHTKFQDDRSRLLSIIIITAAI
jgi:hypothetical protein